MKMPSHPIFPSINPQADIFGLPYLTVLEEACESEKERQRRIDTIERIVGETFKAAVTQLGENDARDTFRRVLRRPKRGLGTALDQNRDVVLLAAHAEAKAGGIKTTELARRLFKTHGKTLGNTAKAIETQIRKVVKEQRKRDQLAARCHRYQRMATRNIPPSLLSMDFKK